MAVAQLAPSAEQIWAGKGWGLLTSAFVHDRLWHLAWDVIWFAILASRLERSVGPARWLAVFVLGAVVTSAAELALVASASNGGSGVRYTIFGLLFVARYRFGQPDKVLSTGWATAFWLWMLGSVVLSLTGKWDLGIAAHLAGLLLGAVMGGATYARAGRGITLMLGVTCVTAAMVCGFWAPWSQAWVRHQQATRQTATTMPAVGR